MRHTTRLGLAVGAGMMLGSLAIKTLTQDWSYLLVAGLVVLVVQLISVLGRRFNAAAWLIHTWQVVAVAGISVGLGLGAGGTEGAWYQRLWQLYLAGALAIRTGSAPMPADPAVRWLFVLLIAIVTIVADVLVVTLGTPAWMLAPLLTLYLIPALALRHDVSWWAFLAIGFGYLVVLAVDTVNTLSGWTRNLVSDTARKQSSQRGVWQLAGVVAAPVLAFSLLIGSLLPTIGSLDIRSQRPQGNGPIQLQDPQIQLNRNLAQQSELVMLTYSTPQPSGVYLRLASLTRFDRNGWHMVPVNLKQGELSVPPGQSSGHPSYTTQVRITNNFGSQYLPAPYAPKSHTAASDQWGYDPVSLMILNVKGNNLDATRNLNYSVTSWQADPNPQTFANASIGIPPDEAETTAVPSDLPPEIRALAQKITKDEATPVLKAAAIQAYLRDPKRFTYSTDAPAGTGYDVTTNFLLTSHRGYCIHFASSMALLARLANIPARMSVGFMPGTKAGDTWVVRGKNMHAWPELYFADYGWVRFEPTAGVDVLPPAWSEVAPNSPPPSIAPPSSATPTPSTSMSPTASAAPSTRPSTVPVVDEGRQIPWGRIAAGVGLGLLLLAFLMAPGVSRALVRRRRLTGTGDAHEDIAAAWREVRDTTLDLGRVWPRGTPREKVAALVRWDGGDSSGDEALGRVAMLVERSRYAANLGDVPTSLATDVQTWRDEQLHGLDRRGRLRVLALPRSLQGLVRSLVRRTPRMN